MIDQSVFSLTIDTKLPPNKITSILNNLRQGVNKQYYAAFSPKQQEFFQYFVWGVLHGLWATHPSSTVKISASTTAGHILMKLAPYYAEQFLSSLTDAIEKTTSDSFFYLSSFCYLAKFTSIEKLSHILNNKPILHLFGPNNSEHLPDLVTEMKKCLNFPREFLRTVVELILQLTYNNPTNRHLPKAASILIGDDVDKYASMIRSDISILLLDNLFPKKLPIFPSEQNETLTSIKDRSINELLNEDPQLSSYEASCKILNKLLISNQIENLSQELTEKITEEVVERSPSLTSLLLLPINPDIIRKMYTTQPADDQNIIISSTSSNFNLSLNSNSTINLTSTQNINSTTNFDSRSSFNSIDFDMKSSNNISLSDNRNQKLFSVIVECDKTKIIPLLTHFSSSISRIRTFFDELISMIFFNLNTSSDAYSFALETLGKVSVNLPDYIMSPLFTKSLNTATSSNNWIHKWWTLRMIGKINFIPLPSKLTTRAFDFIEIAAISKSEKLKQTAKKVSVKLIDHCKHEEYKYFIDRFCRKFDLFDQVSFESRVSYLSYVFQRIPTNWTISFIHIATLLSEAVGLIRFSMNVMREIFIIISVLSNNLQESLVLLFAKQAQLIIDPSFREFCGESINIGQPPIFDREETVTNPLVFKTNTNYSSNLLINNLYNSSFAASSDNSITYIKNIGKSVLVSTFDTDLTSNPSLWHTDQLYYAEAAFEMLSKVQWARFNLLLNDTIYFFNLATRMIELFPDFSNTLASSLIEAPNITFYNLDNYVQKSVVISAIHDTALFSFCKLISLISERFSPNNNLNLKEENECPAFSLTDSKYNTESIVSTISMIFPIMSNVDFLSVLCVQNFMSLMNASITDEICLKVVKPSQKHLIGSSNKNINDMNSASSINAEPDIIIDPNLLYQDNDDDQEKDQNESRLQPTEFELNDDMNGSPLAKNFGFLSFCSSLTPFYYLHIEVPDELFRSGIIFSFALHSTVKITTEEAHKLIEYTLSRATPRVLYFVLRYCHKMKIQIDLTEKLSHPYFVSKRVFLAVLPFLKSMKLPNEYVTTVTGTDDLVNFALSASSLLNRRVGMAIIKFDPKYFMERFMKIEKIKYDQLYNLVLYTCAVSFPADDFFTFAVKIINMCNKSRKKKNLSRRLLSVFIGSNKTNKEIVVNANSLLACEIFPLSTSKEIAKTFTAAQIIEYYYEIATISKTTDCASVIEILCHILSKNTIHGALLNMIIHPQMTFENIQGMISSPFASLQILPFHFYDDKLKYDPDFSDLSPQIVEYLLQTTVIRTASTVATILSFLTHFLNFKNLTRQQLKTAFQFMHKNVDISPQCAALREVMLVYRSFAVYFNQKAEELKTVVDFADKLFEYPIVPNGSINILNQVAYILHDPSHVAVVLTPYLKMKNSYSMCYVCENAATYLLKVKINRIERHSEQLSQLKEQSQQLQKKSDESQTQSEEKQLQSEESQTQSEEKQLQSEESQTQSEEKQQQSEESQTQIDQKQLQSEESQQKEEQNQQQQQQLKKENQQQQQKEENQQQQQPKKETQQQQQQQQQRAPAQLKDLKQQERELKQQLKEIKMQQREQQKRLQREQKQKEKEKKQQEKMQKKQQQMQRSESQNVSIQHSQSQALPGSRIQKQISIQSNLSLADNTPDSSMSSSYYDESMDVIDDAVHVVSIARSFYATFCAIVAVENIRPSMKHDLLKGLFPPIFDYSLKVLDDKDVKIFAPIFALLDEKAEIPKDLVEFIDATKLIIQKRNE